MTPSDNPPPGEQKRRSPRWPLIATAELVETATAARLSARISEIGLFGCYIDALNPFPTGTTVSLRIIRDVGNFTTPARILYSHPGMGMGALFVDTPPDQMAILEKWIAEFGA